jgi:hypothetical protein
MGIMVENISFLLGGQRLKYKGGVLLKNRFDSYKSDKSILQYLLMPKTHKKISIDQDKSYYGSIMPFFEHKVEIFYHFMLQDSIEMKRNNP